MCEKPVGEGPPTLGLRPSSGHHADMPGPRMRAHGTRYRLGQGKRRSRRHQPVARGNEDEGRQFEIARPHGTSANLPLTARGAVLTIPPTETLGRDRTRERDAVISYEEDRMFLRRAEGEG